MRDRGESRWIWNLALGWVATLCAAGIGSAQTAERIDVRRVEVPVRVLRDGEPVRGLSSPDFELRVGGEPTAIASFEEVDFSDSADGGDFAEVSATSRPSYLLLVDRLLTETALVDRARTAAVEFVLSDAHRGALFGVAVWDARGLRILVPFTTDRRQVVQALATLRDEAPPPPEDALGLVIAAPEVAERTYREAREPARTSSRQVRGSRSQASLSERTAQAGNLLAALTELADRFADLPGHQRIVLLSRGFDSELLFGRSGSLRFDRSTTRAAVTATEYGDPALQNAARRLTEALGAADASLDAVDLGSVGSSTAQGTETLRYLARESGGVLLSHRGLAEAFDTLALRTTHTYLLTFEPLGLEPLGLQSASGEAIPIRVGLRDAQRSDRILHRSSFRPSHTKVDALGLSRRVVAGRAGGDLGLELKMLPASPEPEAGLVPLVLELPGAQLLERARQGLLSLRIHGYAVGAEGEIRDHFAQRLELDVRTVGARLERGGLLFLGTFSVPPGTYTARLLVQSDEADEGSLAVADFTVPGPAAHRLVGVAAETDWVVAPGSGAREAAASYVVPETGRPATAVLHGTPGGELLFQVVPSGRVVDARLLAEDAREHALEARAAAGGWLVALPRVPPGRYTVVVQVDGVAEPTTVAAEVLVE